MIIALRSAIGYRFRYMAVPDEANDVEFIDDYLSDFYQLFRAGHAAGGFAPGTRTALTARNRQRRGGSSNPVRLHHQPAKIHGTA
jgi:hypothetical protein